MTREEKEYIPEANKNYIEKEYIFHNMRNAVVQPSEPMNLEEMRAYINGYEDARNALFDIVDTCYRSMKTD